MLLALLLSLLPPALPAAACQDPVAQSEPALKWDGDTEEAYRRALHLWQVRGKPGEAADILLKLAESAEVTQVAGQASWVLVLAAQALAEAGRTDEASALIPVIERGARGTALEASVKRAREALSKVAAVSAIDEDFFLILLSILNTEPRQDDPSTHSGVVFQRITQYRRTVLPYFLEILNRWQSYKIGQQAISRSISWGLAMADSQFVDELLLRVDSLSTLSYVSVVPTSPSLGIDDLAQQQQSRFFAQQARSKDDERVRIAKVAIKELGFNHEVSNALMTVQELVRDNDPRFDDLLLPRNISQDSTILQAVIKDLAALPPSPVIKRARNLLASFGDLATLRDLAVHGDIDDVTRYLMCLVAIYGENSQRSIGNQMYGSMAYLQSRTSAPTWKELNLSFRNKSLPVEGLPKEVFSGFSFTERHLHEPGFRTLLAMAAICVKDPIGFASAYDGSIPADDAHLLVAIDSLGFLPPAFIPSLTRLIGDPLLRELAWRLALRHAPQIVDVAFIQSAGYEIINNRSSELAEFFISNSRIKDLMEIAIDSRCSSNGRSNIVNEIMARSDAWKDHLQDVIRLVDSEKDIRYRQGMIQQASAAVRRLQPSVVGSRTHRESVEVLNALFDANFDCWIAPPLIMQWEEYGKSVTEEFSVTGDRMEWFAKSALIEHGPEMISFVLFCIERGVPVELLVKQGGLGLQRFMPEGDPRLIDAARMLWDRSDLQARQLALDCLAQNKDAAFRLWEFASIAWEEPELATRAAIAFQRYPDRGALAAKLVAAWKLPGLQNRGDMMLVISSLASVQLMPILLEAMIDPDQQVANSARMALERLKSLEEQRAFWESWQATGVGGSPTAALLRQIQSKNKEVRLSAIRALGAVKAPEALPLLISLLEDPDPEVVAAARAALAWLQPDAAPK